MTATKTAPKADTGKEPTVEERLKELFNLQAVDSEIDKIHTMKGELPMEVNDLKDEITGLETRIGKIQEEIKGMDAEVNARKTAMKDAEALIKKYGKQQNNVKNNREYEALTKEIELQTLEIQLCEKKIAEGADAVKSKKAYLKESKEYVNSKKDDLETKKSELKKIIGETEKEEDKLIKQSNKAKKQVDDRLLTAYERIRKNFQNGLAVVKIERDACGGCFNTIPPQRQLEISQRKKIIICEHCGRILVDSNIDK